MWGKAGSPHLLTVDQLDKEGIVAILDRADELEAAAKSGGLPQTLTGKIIALLFFQPSTRTRMGFHAAALRLGGQVMELNEVKHQPGMSRGESIADTVRCVSHYCDAIVMRHGSWEAMQEAAETSEVPLINAGAGTEHHPIQALVDLAAIRRRFGKIEGLRIGIVGDLKGSRAAKSLVGALRHFPPAELRLMAPAGRELPKDALRVTVALTTQSLSCLDVEDLDVIYMAGLPEGAGVEAVDPRVRRRFRLTLDHQGALANAAVILCPLPRIDEIDPTIDQLTSAFYFDQNKLALAVRKTVVEMTAPEVIDQTADRARNRRGRGELRIGW